MKGIWKEILGQEAEVGHNFDPSESGLGIDPILDIHLSELAKREMAIRVYSDILGRDVWLCSNKAIAQKVEADDPEAITYTVAEMRQLIKLNPGPEDLKNMHNAKVVFPGSKIVDSRSYERRDCKIEIKELKKKTKGGSL